MAKEVTREWFLSQAAREGSGLRAGSLPVHRGRGTLGPSPHEYHRLNRREQGRRVKLTYLHLSMREWL